MPCVLRNWFTVIIWEVEIIVCLAVNSLNWKKIKWRIHDTSRKEPLASLKHISRRFSNLENRLCEIGTNLFLRIIKSYQSFAR